MDGEDILMLRQKELKRLHVIRRVLEGVIKQVEASKDIHEELEKVAVEGHWQEDSYRGFYYIKDYINFGYNICSLRERYVPFIEKWCFKSGLELLKKMMVPRWANTVQDIVDFWLTVLRNGFGEQKYEELGLPEPVEIRKRG